MNPQVGDTETIGYTSMTGGSGAAFKTGWASFEAAQDVKRQMIERAALMWEADVDQIGFADGVFSHKSDPELSIGFKQMAERLTETRRSRRGTRQPRSGRPRQRIRHSCCGRRS